MLWTEDISVLASNCMYVEIIGPALSEMLRLCQRREEHLLITNVSF